MGKYRLESRKACLSVQFSHSVMSNSVTPWTAACQSSLSITNSLSLLKLMSIESVMPSNHLILSHPLLLPPSIFPSIRALPMSQFFASGGQSIGALASASFLPINIQDYFLQDGLFGSPCSPRDSQESSPTPQFKNINSSPLRFLHSPTLTSIYDYWENHSLDQIDLCQQSNGSAFNMVPRLVITGQLSLLERA